MTGTNLCVNKPHCVPVIFEPPCTIYLAMVTLGSVDITVIVLNTIPAVNTVHASYGFLHVVQRKMKIRVQHL
jgi:hypothetical protein